MTRSIFTRANALQKIYDLTLQDLLIDESHDLAAETAKRVHDFYLSSSNSVLAGWLADAIGDGDEAKFSVIES